MYAVAGATGHTGSRVAATLLDRGEKIRVIVRSEEKGAPWRARGADVFVASLTDPQGLAEALRGADGLYFLIPPNLKSEDMVAEYRPFANSLVQALRTEPIPHVVYLSTWGAGLKDGPFRMHYETEQAFRASSVPFTFLRGSYFMENSTQLLPVMREQGVLPSFFTPGAKLPMVAATDLGRVAADALTDPPSETEVLEVTGPTEYSMNDMAAAYSRTIGKPISVAPVPDQQIVPTMLQFGASEAVARFFHDMISAMERGEIARDAEARFIRGAVTLDQFVDELLSSDAAKQRAA